MTEYVLCGTELVLPGSFGFVYKYHGKLESND